MLQIGIQEEYSTPNYVAEIKTTDILNGEGVIGLGTNKLIVHFGDIYMKPIPVPKDGKVDNEELMAMVKGVEAKLDMPNVSAELSLPAVAIESEDLPMMAMGINAGMAPKVNGIAQEDMITFKQCSVSSSPEDR